MNPQAIILSAKVHSELSALKLVVERTLQAWQKASQQADDFYLDSVALNLYSFTYSYQIKAEKLRLLVENLNETFLLASEELNWFTCFLNEIDE